MASTEATEAPETKYFTRAEVAKHSNSEEVWLIINNSVYDVTNFLNEHPGGEEILIDQAGQDSTEAFEDVGHSTDARQMMVPYKIGEIVKEERTSEKDKKNKGSSGDYSRDHDSSGSWRSWLIPIALGIMATLVYRYFISTH